MSDGTNYDRYITESAIESALKLGFGLSRDQVLDLLIAAAPSIVDAITDEMDSVLLATEIAHARHG